MTRKSLTWLHLLFGAMFVLGAIAPQNAYAVSPALLKKFLESLANSGKTIPKQADKLPPSSGLPKLKDLGLNLPLITRTLARASQKYICPSMSFRVSLPQLNVSLTASRDFDLRSGPGTNHQSQTTVNQTREYVVDMLTSNKCWVRIRYKGRRGLKKTGWVNLRDISFEFDDHLTKPQNKLTETLGADEVYRLVSNSTYKIDTPSAQGTAVAISPTVLLTNCHVLGEYDTVQILEDDGSYKANLIHDDKSKDKCFIRSLTLEVRPVPNVQEISNVHIGIRVYTIGAPLGNNRSIGEGAVVGEGKEEGVRWIIASAPVEPGSSGGGLFDSKGNLIGITTLKLTALDGQNYSASIAADDFWQ